jgi:hypothetical protein
VIASNLGVNDLNHFDSTVASDNYIKVYKALLNTGLDVYVNGQKVNSNWKKSGNVIEVDFNFISVNPINEALLNAYDKNNTRTTAKIINFNQKMSAAFGSKYLDSYSKFNDWFAQTEKNGKPKFLYKECKDNNNNTYQCEDGCHYSEYMEKTYIYNFYKSKLLG